MVNYFPGNVFALMKLRSMIPDHLSMALCIPLEQIYCHLNNSDDPEKAPAEELRTYCRYFCEAAMIEMNLQRLLYEDLSYLLAQSGQMSYGPMRAIPEYHPKEDLDPRP